MIFCHGCSRFKKIWKCHLSFLNCRSCGFAAYALSDTQANYACVRARVQGDVKGSQHYLDNEVIWVSLALENGVMCRCSSHGHLAVYSWPGEHSCTRPLPHTSVSPSSQPRRPPQASLWQTSKGWCLIVNKTLSCHPNPLIYSPTIKKLSLVQIQGFDGYKISENTKWSLHCIYYNMGICLHVYNN